MLQGSLSHFLIALFHIGIRPVEIARALSSPRCPFARYCISIHIVFHEDEVTSLIPQLMDQPGRLYSFPDYKPLSNTCDLRSVTNKCRSERNIIRFSRKSKFEGIRRELKKKSCFGMRNSHRWNLWLRASIQISETTKSIIGRHFQIVGDWNSRLIDAPVSRIAGIILLWREKTLSNFYQIFCAHNVGALSIGFFKWPQNSRRFEL